MSKMRTVKGRLRLVENLEGETTYERKAMEIIPTLPHYDEEDFNECYKDDFADRWEECLAAYQDWRGREYVVLEKKIFEIVEYIDLDSSGFCHINKNENGELEFLANWYNGGTCLKEVLEEL